MYQRKVKGIAGESYWDTYCVPLKNEMGETESFVQVARNITDQTQAMDALRESEGTLKAILAASPVGIGLVRNRTLDWANAAMYRILGYEEDSLVGEGAKMLYLDDEECNRAGHELYPGMDETGIGQTETRWITKEGGVIDCYLQASPLDPSDPGKGHIVAAMDITDRKRADERIHTLTQQLMKAQENERQRISLYLHDDVAQNLATLKIGLETVFDDQPTPPRELTQRVSKFSQILQRVISAVRDLAYDQHPPGLDQLGLVQAVFQYCESHSEQNGLRVDFHSAGMDDLKLDFDTEINLYRLIQEALTNISKHADASRATVRLVATHPNIILRIEDNGKGFDVEGRLLAALDEKRMGLQGMEERVNLLNGKLRIQSRLGEGTRIFVEVLYKEKRVGSEKKHSNH
jgi:PAS domain S-box-containing protein